MRLIATLDKQLKGDVRLTYAGRLRRRAGCAPGFLDIA
jgi:hypothetical protein